MNDFNYDNEIIEVNNDNIETLEDLIQKEAESSHQEPQKPKKKKINLSKKQKITLIVVGSILLLLIIGVILYFVFKKDEEPEKKEEPIVIIEKDNYRYENGKLIFLNTNEKDIGSYECNNKDSEQCYVTKITYDNDTFDRIKNVYKNGEELIKNSKIYYDKYVFVSDGDKSYLYNINTQETELEVKKVKTYNTNENLAVIENENSLYGLIEITEEGYEYLIRCSYNNLGIVNTKDLLLVAQDKDKQYIIDSEGKKLSSDIKAEIKSASKNYVVGKIGNTYNIFSYDYEELVSDYDFIGIHDNVISLVKKNRLYLINENLSKLYEDGIRLESTDYVKKYVYDEDNRLVETLKSYEIENKNGNVQVVINNDITEINVFEGLLSSNLSYINYFEGKLYIYSDEEKTDLLGTYKCNNINNIKSEEEGLVNCGIYINELGASGIYNNEYVFIYDYEGSNKIYYLYNLKENKTKGTYSEIEILNPKELNENIKHIYTSSSFIKAKSATGTNKGNYGVIEITGERVQGKVGFKYESITKEKDYYKLISVDKTYSLYDKDFKKISNEFSYIELFDKYYVGINNNKLNVFKYDNQMEILKESVNITDNKFTIDFTDGFAITVNDITYNYDKSGNIIQNNVSDNEIIEGEDGSDGEQE